MAIHDKFAALALRLLPKHGRTIELRRSGTTNVDPLKPWRGQTDLATGSAPAGTVACTGTFFNQADLDNFGLKESDLDGRLLKAGEQWLLVADLDLSPSEDVSQFDAVLDSGRVWRIVSANVLQPGTTRILYDFTVRQ